VTIRKFRNALAKLRFSSQDLEIEKGRYQNILREQRICKFCHEAIGNEYHLVLVCIKLSLKRESYIDKRFFNNPNNHKFNVLMCSHFENVTTMYAMYAYYAFKERNDIPSITDTDRNCY
jgi:hypothetical protein